MRTIKKMGLFSKKTQEKSENEKPLSKPDQDLVSLIEANGVSSVIAREMQKMMSYSDFMAFEQADDQGGYFGQEMDIRSNAGRIKGLYSREPWIYLTSSLVARTLSAIPFKVYQVGNDKALEAHPLIDILSQGSELEDEKSMKWCQYLDLDLAGNSFLIIDEKFKSIIGRIPVEQCQPNYNRDEKRVDGIWVYDTVASGSRRWYPIEYVIHHKIPNPYTPLYGLSPFAAAARPILLDRYKSEFEMAFYLRGATSSGVVETTEELSKQRLQRLMTTFEQSFTGRANWWRTLFLPKGAKWTKSSLTMAEMQHLDGLRENRKTILAIRGIPPSMVGFTEDVNRATSEQQERTFWANTIIPLSWFVASGWNNSYLVKGIYRGKVEVRPDFSSIAAVEGSILDKSERAKAMENYFWIDEIREKIFGEGPAPEGSGQKFVAEIRGSAQTTSLALSATASTKELPLKAPEGFEIQTLIFSKEKFPKKEDAINWAKDNGFLVTKEPDETADSWRIRQKDPDDFDAESFRTIELRDGVSAVIGKILKKSIEPDSDTFQAVKASATGSQNRIESKLAEPYGKAVKAYINEILDQAAKALREKMDVRSYLRSRIGDRLNFYLERATPALEKALDRGFSVAASQVKCLVPSTKAIKFNPLSDQDRQAIDVLQEKTKRGQRKILADRSISSFKGFDRTRTDLIMGIIEDGYSQGLTIDQIVGTLREKYNESYSNQFNTITRTEILTAVSQGQAWNHEVLGQVFSQVKKQWLHQGDIGVNPDAREEHGEFEAMGEVPSDFKWHAEDGSQLAYPRDPSGEPGSTINCRCTMISVIPPNATSNADHILDLEF
jgi:HK97 family phage portal protein